MVNGEVRQQARYLAAAVPTCPRWSRYVSTVMTLLPGDVLLTGTPAGVGPLEDVGDEVSVTIENIGSLRNTVVNRDWSTPPGLRDNQAAGGVRVRFAPVAQRRPARGQHPGPALYAWAFSRHTAVRPSCCGSRTPTGAGSPPSTSPPRLDYTLRWLGLQVWIEGPEVGGPVRPVTCRASGWTHLHGNGSSDCSPTATPTTATARREELAASAGRRPAPGAARAAYRRALAGILTAEQVAAYQAEGRKPVVRFRMPSKGPPRSHDLGPRPGRYL